MPAPAVRRPHMRGSIAVMISALTVIVLIAPPAHGGGRDTTYVVAECGRLRTTPARIEFGCTGGLYVDHLTWFRWHRFKAFGGGLFHMNDCHPNCAEGTYHTEWGHIWLRNRARCEPVGSIRVPARPHPLRGQAARSAPRRVRSPRLRVAPEEGKYPKERRRPSGRAVNAPGSRTEPSAHASGPFR